MVESLLLHGWCGLGLRLECWDSGDLPAVFCLVNSGVGAYAYSRKTSDQDRSTPEVTCNCGSRVHKAISLSSLLLFLVHLLLPAYLAAGLPGPSISESLSKLRFEEELTPPGLRFLDSGKGGSDGEEEQEGNGSRRNTIIIGTTLLGSGIFLCSWGITAWEIQEYQCCPARNTGNVVKIVAGIVLINGGLMYLLGASD